MKLNEEQLSAWEDFLRKQSYIEGLQKAMLYFEKINGVVNKDIINFRLLINKESKELQKLGNIIENLNIPNVFLENLKF